MQIPLLKNFSNLKIYKHIQKFFFIKKRQFGMRKEKNIFIQTISNIFSSSMVFGNGFISIYLYINFRSIVLFLDGEIADRQTSNSSNSLGNV